MISEILVYLEPIHLVVQFLVQNVQQDIIAQALTINHTSVKMGTFLQL